VTLTTDGKAAEGKTEQEPTLVERWLEDQRAWQKTAMAYFDSLVKNEDFLVHLGNAMRGSLLAGKPYPSAAPGPAAEEAPADDRLDRVLFALHEIQGQLADLRLALEELRARGAAPAAAAPARQKRAAKAPRKARPGRSRSRV
jgi:hypothetical protein